MYIKAKLALLLIAVNWGTLILLMSPLMLVAALYDRFVNRDIKWTYSLFLAQDHLVNVIMGGHFLTTISAVLGHLQASGSKSGDIAARVVDKLFYISLGQVGHCAGAGQAEDVHQFSASRSLLGTAVYLATLYFIFWI